MSQGYLGLWIEEVIAITPACDLMAGEHVEGPSSVGRSQGLRKAQDLVDQDSSPCSRSFRYKFRSLIPRILAALPR
jgi:hypothetical protein